MKKQGLIIGDTILVALMSLSFLVSTGTPTTTALLISGSTTLQPVITDISTAYDNYRWKYHGSVLAVVLDLNCEY